jgi:hypothetical protein
VAQAIALLIVTEGQIDLSGIRADALPQQIGQQPPEKL